MSAAFLLLLASLISYVRLPKFKLTSLLLFSKVYRTMCTDLCRTASYSLQKWNLFLIFEATGIVDRHDPLTSQASLYSDPNRTINCIFHIIKSALLIDIFVVLYILLSSSHPTCINHLTLHCAKT